jgi:hypothetical protein
VRKRLAKLDDRRLAELFEHRFERVEICNQHAKRLPWVCNRADLMQRDCRRQVVVGPLRHRQYSLSSRSKAEERHGMMEPFLQFHPM